MPQKLPNRFFIILIFILAAGNISVLHLLMTEQELKITVLELGKGIAILAQDSRNRTILINTGPDASILRAIGMQLPPWQRNLDTVVLTSTQTRFAGGLPEVMNRYRIKNLIRFGGEGSKSIETAIAAASAAELPKGSIAAKDFYQTAAPYGTRLSISDSHIDILSPEKIVISYGTALLAISSSTPSGVYVLTN